MQNSKKLFVALALVAGLAFSVINTAFATTVNCSSSDETCYKETTSVLFGLVKTERIVYGSATSVEISN